MAEQLEDMDPNVVFGDLISRLHKIRYGNFDYLRKAIPRHQLDPIVQDGFKLKASVVLPFLTESISQIHSILVNIDAILDQIVFKEEYPEDFLLPKISIAEVRARTKADLSSELNVYIHHLEDIVDTRRKFSEIGEEESLYNRKIKLKISVIQFGALIRLLGEIDVFDEPNITALCTLLAKSFVTKKGGSSVDALRNAMRNLDSKGFTYWEEKLPEMQGKIAKIRKL